MLKISNKKAQGRVLGPFGSLVTATLLVFILLIAFFIFSKSMAINPKVGNLEALSGKGQNLDSLIAYLKTPVNVNGQMITMADLIRLSKADASYRSTLEAKTREIFDNVYNAYAIGSTGIFSIDKGYSKSGVITERITIFENIEVYLQIKK